VFVAGIYNFSNIKLIDKLNSISSKIVSIDKQNISKNKLHIITGKKSDLANQGDVLIVDNMLLTGKVYNKKSYNPITRKEFLEYSLLPFEYFVDNFWGNYICLRHNNDKLEILRDPVGQLPLFYSILKNGEIIFSSELEVVSKLSNNTDYNWNYLCSYIVHGFITSSQTFFNNIYELPHGCKLDFDSNSEQEKTSVAWNPKDYLRNCDNLCDTHENIIQITSSVIKSWASDSDVISLDFSGGTDSTGLLFILNEIFGNNKEIKLINMYHPEVSASDEREYARSIAKQLGLSLIEFDHSKSMPFDPDLRVMKCKPNWPTSILSYQKINNDVSDIMSDRKNVMYVSGHGGDHIFSCPPPITSLCDYLMDEGINGFGNKLLDIYTIYRKPLFPVIYDVFKGFFSYYALKYESPSYHLYTYKKAPWLHKDAFIKANQLDYHPFFKMTNQKKCYPGEFSFIDTIYSGLSTIKTDIRDRGLNSLFFPLFSQPLLELALSIPTYQSYYNGYNRYQFRKAISDRYKTNSVWRMDKGETSGVSQKGMKTNKKRIIELCMEGKLVKQGLIDKDLLYIGLQEVINGKKDYQWAITNLFCAELFITYWD